MVETAELPAVVLQRPETLGRLFLDRVSATPGREAYRYPGPTGWTSVTWQETAERVRRIAAGLVARGIQPEERVAIASTTRLEWILADLAILCSGAATTTVYPSSLPDEVAFILGDSGSRLLFVEDLDQVEKVRAHRDRLPALETVVLLVGDRPSAIPTSDVSASDGGGSDATAPTDWLLTLADLEALGAARLAVEPDVVERRVDQSRGEHLATLIYTSGTTGRPKGVRLSHATWTYEAAAVDALDILSIEDLQFLWLPLAHSFGKVLLSAQLAIGFPTAVDGRVDRIVDNLAEVRPTFMGAAPRIFEKAHARIVMMTAKEGGLRKRIVDRAFDVGRRVGGLRMAGSPVPRRLVLEHALYDRLVFAKIRARFGGRVRFFVSGAAALNPFIAEWFHAAGILILEGYGLTETSAGTCINRPTRYKFGTVGPPLPGMEFRVSDEGELLVRGPGVMDGYHNQPAETAEVFVDGWFATGDLGEIDAEGYVRVTDRKKDLFKTSGGKYVAPQAIEGCFKAVCPCASHLVAFGDRRNYVTALVTLDADAIAEWATEQGLGNLSYAEVVTSEQARAMVQDSIDELNKRLNRWETIKRFAILDRDLSVAEGEITPSLKVKRKVVAAHHADLIDSLYA